MLNQEFDLARLFAGFLAGNLTQEQKLLLEDWIAASEEHRSLFERVCRGEHVRDLNRMAERYDREKAWQRIEGNFKPSPVRFVKRWMMWAAILILPLCVGYVLLHRGSEVLKEPHPIVATGQPGTFKASLTMADGSVIELEGDEVLRLEEKDGTLISKDSALLSYRTAAQTANAGGTLVYNRMEVPRGGEYSLVLSDGTVVYLNAMSSLRYPVNFGKGVREVELTGEGYFQVRKDTARPFIVRTGEIKVQVLGTEFNVSAYEDETVVETTLVKGSVRVMNELEQESVVIKPSQQAVFSRNSGQLAVREVDVAACIAWKNGKFDFRDWRLEDMMNYLARWYDIEVFYQSEELKDVRFGCYITRYSEIKPILEFLEKTGKLQVSMKGKTIVFTHR